MILRRRQEIGSQQQQQGEENEEEDEEIIIGRYRAKTIKDPRTTLRIQEAAAASVSASSVHPAVFLCCANKRPRASEQGNAFECDTHGAKELKQCPAKSPPPPRRRGTSWTAEGKV